MKESLTGIQNDDMERKHKYIRHYEENVEVNANAESIFTYADDHTNFSSHMNKSSWMMGGGKMETQVDEGKGKEIGSHIQMHGNVLGFKLFLDEVIVKYEPPYYKAWETIGDLSLLVIDHYRLGFDIKPDNPNARFRVYIDYNLPQSVGSQTLGHLFGRVYAKWCVQQMIKGVVDHFNVSNK